MQTQMKRSITIVLTKQDIEESFHLPFHEACCKLKTTTEELIYWCRTFDISRFVAFSEI
jgi:hypothetical protein